MYGDDQTSKNQPPWPVRTDFNLGEDYAPGEQIKVRCIDPRGLYYNFNRRRYGDVFTLIPHYVTKIDPKTDKPMKENGQTVRVIVTAEEQFSPNTMEKVDPSEQENITTAQAALNKVQEELDSAKSPARSRR